MHVRHAAALLLSLSIAACGSNSTETAPEAEAMIENEIAPQGVARESTTEPVPSAVIPRAFRGIYDASLEACGRPSEDRLVVGPRELRFHESIGAVRQVRVDSEAAIQLTADFEGEGERWTAVHRVELGGGGERLTVVGEGTRLTRVRCGDASVAAPRTAWHESASGEGASLFLLATGAARELTIFCPSGSDEVLVNVPAFRPVSSEERMTFGAGGQAVTLVADSSGDRGRGGVSAAAPLPEELRSILTGGQQISVNYGAQNSGPHPPPPAALAAPFLAACTD